MAGWERGKADHRASGQQRVGKSSPMQEIAVVGKNRKRTAEKLGSSGEQKTLAAL